jgi:hypothetical protein
MYCNNHLYMYSCIHPHGGCLPLCDVEEADIIYIYIYIYIYVYIYIYIPRTSLTVKFCSYQNSYKISYILTFLCYEALIAFWYTDILFFFKKTNHVLL